VNYFKAPACVQKWSFLYCISP